MEARVGILVVLSLSQSLAVTSLTDTRSSESAKRHPKSLRGVLCCSSASRPRGAVVDCACKKDLCGL